VGRVSGGGLGFTIPQAMLIRADEVIQEPPK
jgi:hypothetical protein